MSTDSTLPKLSLPEIASLIVLMAEAREVSNNELLQLSGFTLTGKARLKLNDLKLVDTRKVGRTFSHQLTEHGWGLCRELLRAERPARAGAAGGALFALLASVDRGLTRAKLSPADFFMPPTVAEPTAVAEPPVGAAVAVGAAGDVESLIRMTYRRLATEPGGWVGLAELRPALKQLSRQEIDDALRNMIGSPGVHLIPVANLKSLTPADRDAALSLGGEDNHALSIEGA
jgi:hypothetical protein